MEELKKVSGKRENQLNQINKMKKLINFQNINFLNAYVRVRYTLRKLKNGKQSVSRRERCYIEEITLSVAILDWFK